MSHTSIREAEPALHAIVETILPAFPALPEAVRRGVAGDVAAYVACQIDAMPSFLRLPYRLALLAFTWLPALRFGGPFAALPAAARASCLAIWTDSPLAPMRDFVKLIRSTALLVYYDHPVVLEQLSANGIASAARGARDG